MATERPQRELLHGCRLPDLPQHHRLHGRDSVICVIPTYHGGAPPPGQGGSTMTATSADTSETSATLTIGGGPQPGAAASYPVHNPARPAEIVGYAPGAALDQLYAAGRAAAGRAAPGGRAPAAAGGSAAVPAPATTAAAQLASSDGAQLYTRE